MHELESKKLLRVAGALSIFIHIAGLLFALFGIRPGTAVFPLDARMAHIATSHWGWQLGWGVWLLAAVAFVFFMAAVAKAWKLQGGFARWARIVGTVAACLDSLFDLLQIIVLPAIVAERMNDFFVEVADFSSFGGIVVANGLYSIAVLLMTLALRGRISETAYKLGWLNFGCGMLLAASGFFQDPRLPEIFAGPAIGSYMLWVLALMLQSPGDVQN